MLEYPNMIGDSRFLNDLGGYTKRHGYSGIVFIRDVCDEVTAAWSKFGIAVCSDAFGAKNKYYVNGQEISREEAMLRACKKVGKNINDMHFTDY